MLSCLPPPLEWQNTQNFPLMRSVRVIRIVRVIRVVRVIIRLCNH